MGYSISWLGVKGKPPEQVRRELGLSETAETAQYCDVPFVGCALPTGWYLIIANGCDNACISDKKLTGLSRDCAVVALSSEEHVMTVWSSCWRDGKCEWRVEHSSKQGKMHLSVLGTTPDTLEEIRTVNMDRQKADKPDPHSTDFVFEIPMELARRITGFRYDDNTPDVTDEDFRVLKATTHVAAAASENKPWWKVW